MSLNNVGLNRRAFVKTIMPLNQFVLQDNYHSPLQLYSSSFPPPTYYSDDIDFWVKLHKSMPVTSAQSELTWKIDTFVANQISASVKSNDKPASAHASVSHAFLLSNSHLARDQLHQDQDKDEDKDSSDDDDDSTSTLSSKSSSSTISAASSSTLSSASTTPSTAPSLFGAVAAPDPVQLALHAHQRALDAEYEQALARSLWEMEHGPWCACQWLPWDDEVDVVLMDESCSYGENCKFRDDEETNGDEAMGEGDDGLESKDNGLEQAAEIMRAWQREAHIQKIREQWRTEHWGRLF